MAGMDVTAAYLSDVGAPFEIRTLELSEPRATEVLVRIVASGVCASDAHTRSGRIPSPLPSVLGHEGAGVVEAVGVDVAHVAPGDHVALSWMPSCGRCRHCLSGRPVLCTAAAAHMLAGTLLDGTSRLSNNGEMVFHYSFLSTFATHAVVPAASAVKIDDDVPLATAALVGCAILTGYGAVVNRAQVRPGSSVLIFGAGGVGLSAVMGAQIAGARRIIVVDPVAAKREEATRFGATSTFAPSNGLVHQVRELTEGFGADYAIDAVGGEGILEQAFEATVAGGTIVCVGVPGAEAKPSLPGPALVRQEKIVTGSLYGSSRPAIDMPKILDLFKDGRLPLDRLISKTYELGQINAAFDDLAAGALNRGVLVIDPELAF
jgi:NDMA-dependent alcohol dehydrogenase